MRSGKVQGVHFSDARGNPAGGTTWGPGFAIGWQNGPLQDNAYFGAANGAFVEDVIQAAIERLEFYQLSKFACHYNQSAINRLKQALEHLEARTKDREARGVEGTHVV